MRAKKVYQYSLDGVFIKEYESIRAAAMIMGVNCANLINCTNGKQMESCGYIWLTSKDDEEAKRISVLLNRPINNHYDANEEWRDIPEYEGLYQVSTSGMVRSLYTRTNERGNNILNPIKRNKGLLYLAVSLYKDGKYKFHFVHRLVAAAFVPNPDNLPCINHKDENPSNNHVGNLEWCTREYNNKYGNHPRANINHPSLSRPVSQYKDGVLIATYPSISEAKRVIGRRNIHAVLKGRKKRCGGFEWKYAD